MASQFEEFIKGHGDDFQKGQLDETGRSNDSVRGDRIRWPVGSELHQPCVGTRHILILLRSGRGAAARCNRTSIHTKR